jgi:hypothetical protein
MWVYSQVLSGSPSSCYRQAQEREVNFCVPPGEVGCGPKRGQYNPAPEREPAKNGPPSGEAAYSGGYPFRTWSVTLEAGYVWCFAGP